jgi:sterol desaturase/sphingolipid hydroxylase (fatty acid hydroxylase superfamily)
VPAWFAYAASLLLFDLVVYCRHRLFHHLLLLWRLHRRLRADIEFDVTTGTLFHPFEILLSMILKAGAALALGAPPSSVLALKILLSGTSLFIHANARLPPCAEGLLRLVLVTRTCTARIIRCCRLRHTATSAFALRGGTAYSAPSGCDPRRGIPP